MRKPVGFRLDEEILLAARDCATRERRTLTNFVEISLRDRIGVALPEVARPNFATARNTDRTPRDD